MDHKEIYKSLKIEGKNFMDKLIIRALLGVREAQRECTEKGVVLPCPCCGGKADIWRNGNIVFVKCSVCGLTMQDICESYVLANWNTRTAPPIGQCGECKWYVAGYEWEGGYIPSDCTHPLTELYVINENDFCSYFEPKGDKEND